MSFGPQVVMPGAFHFEAPNGAAPRGGAQAGIFRPPSSPSASSSMYLARSSGSLYSQSTTPASNTKKKRQRAGDSTLSNDWTTANDARLNIDDEADDHPVAGGRTSGGREIQYTLAGQIETPDGTTQRDFRDMEDSVYSDVDYRRALGSKRPHSELDSPLSRHGAPGLDINRPSQGDGWSKLALNTIGGVVGKVWEFCKAGAFRGFYAGGGTGYAMSNGQVWCNEHDVPTLPQYGHSPVPIGFPESDYAPFYYEREGESTPPPAAKRRQLFDNTRNDELRKNWVMVDDPVSTKRPRSAQQPALRPPINRRVSKPVSRLSVPSFGRRHSGRISHAGGATLTTREPASFASSRSPVVEHRPPTPSRLPVLSRPHSPSPFSPNRRSRQPSKIPSPSPYSHSYQNRGHRRTQSAASDASAATAATAATAKLRKRESTHDIVEESSPRLAPEVKRLAAKMLQEERATDARINDFNARLKEMIRQGKEALGTAIEIEEHTGVLDSWDDDD